MKTIYQLVVRNPLVTGMFLFNTGIFAWLQTTSSAIVSRLNVSENLASYVPAPILQLTGDNLSAIQAFVGNSAWAWLVFSMLILVVIHVIKGLVKFLFVVAILVIGIYLIWQNQEMLTSLIGG